MPTTFSPQLLRAEDLDGWVLLPDSASSDPQPASALLAYCYFDAGRIVARPIALVGRDGLVLREFGEPLAPIAVPPFVLQSPDGAARPRPDWAPLPFLTVHQREHAVAQSLVAAGVVAPVPTWRALVARYTEAPEFYEELAKWLEREGELEEAEAHFREAFARSGDPFYQTQLAVFTANQERHAEAIDHLFAAHAGAAARVSRTDPQDPARWLLAAIEVQLARSYWCLGRVDEARAIAWPLRDHPEHGPQLEEIFDGVVQLDAPWCDDPALKGRFVPGYSDDLQVLVHDGGPKFSDLAPELIYARIVAVDGEVYRAIALSQPRRLLSLKAGDTFMFIASHTAGRPTLVCEAYRRERRRWRISPCQGCGQSEAFDPPSALLAKTGFESPKATSTVVFSQQCPACLAGTLVFTSLDAAPTPRDGEPQWYDHPMESFSFLDEPPEGESSRLIEYPAEADPRWFADVSVVSESYQERPHVGVSVEWPTKPHLAAFVRWLRDILDFRVVPSPKPFYPQPPFEAHTPVRVRFCRELVAHAKTEADLAPISRAIGEGRALLARLGKPKPPDLAASDDPVARLLIPDHLITEALGLTRAHYMDGASEEWLKAQPSALLELSDVHHEMVGVRRDALISEFLRRSARALTAIQRDEIEKSFDEFRLEQRFRATFPEVDEVARDTVEVSAWPEIHHAMAHAFDRRCGQASVLAAAKRHRAKLVPRLVQALQQYSDFGADPSFVQLPCTYTDIWRDGVGPATVRDLIRLALIHIRVWRYERAGLCLPAAPKPMGPLVAAPTKKG